MIKRSKMPAGVKKLIKQVDELEKEINNELSLQ